MASDDWADAVMETGDQATKEVTPSETAKFLKQIKDQDESIRYAQTVINIMQKKSQDDFSAIIQLQAKIQISGEDLQKFKDTEDIVSQVKVENENKFASFQLSFNEKLTKKQEEIHGLHKQLNQAKQDTQSQIQTWVDKYNKAQSEYNQKLSEKSNETTEKDESLLTMISNYKEEIRDLKNKLNTPNKEVKVRKKKLINKG